MLRHLLVRGLGVAGAVVLLTQCSPRKADEKLNAAHVLNILCGAGDANPVQAKACEGDGCVVQ
ncbi:MAG: hypothetical protein L0Y64_10355, partial [Myxococcaceae bacterium]|nr:hypothetical protein [Myxococcaceae bacterium]